MRNILIGVLLFISACAGSKREIGQCDGPMEFLNSGQWQPTPELVKYAERYSR